MKLWSDRGPKEIYAWSMGCLTYHSYICRWKVWSHHTSGCTRVRPPQTATHSRHQCRWCWVGPCPSCCTGAANHLTTGIADCPVMNESGYKSKLLSFKFLPNHTFFPLHYFQKNSSTNNPCSISKFLSESVVISCHHSVLGCCTFMLFSPIHESVKLFSVAVTQTKLFSPMFRMEAKWAPSSTQADSAFCHDHHSMFILFLCTVLYIKTTAFGKLITIVEHRTRQHDSS